MDVQLPFLFNDDDSFAVINACYALTEQYRNMLIELGEEHQLSENEMRVLVHLARYPEACTQKKLQETHLQLSISSICRMVASLRTKNYLTTCLDKKDRRSWLIHLEAPGRELTDAFRQRLQMRLESIFQGIPGFDVRGFANAVTQATAMEAETASSA